MSESPDEYVPAVVHSDTCRRLENLYDAALELRAYAGRAAQTYRRIGEPHLAVRLEIQLERLDAAIADALEVLT